MVATGLGISGVATYAFFAVASRALEAERYAAVAVLWSLLFAVGNGVMQPLEQEVARAVAARRAVGDGAGPVVRRAAAIGASFTVALVVLALGVEQAAGVGYLDRRLTLGHLLDDDPVLVAAFLVGLTGFAAGHLVRGTLSSQGRFGGYARFFGVDGLTRVVLAGALAAVGVEAAGPFGAVLAVAPMVGVAAGLAGERELLAPGSEAHTGELTRALGWLLAGTVSLALVVQGGTIAVDLLAEPHEADAAGVFLNGLVIARIPLFLFQAVLASLLPRLSRLAGAGELAAFTGALRRLVVAIAAVGALATVAAALLGPSVIGVVFGGDAGLDGRDLAMLAGTFILIMIAICLDQALVALAEHPLMASGWVLALAAFGVVTALGDDLFWRVELGLATASVVAVVWMGSWLSVRLRGRPRADEVTMAEAAAEAPLPE